MLRKIAIFITLLIILFYSNCGKKAGEGVVGQEIVVKPELPADTVGVQFLWTIKTKPDTSKLTVLNLNPSSRSAYISFVPDAPGVYKLVLEMTNLDGKEVGTQKFTFKVKEAEGEVKKEMPSAIAETVSITPQPIGEEKGAPATSERMIEPVPRMDLGVKPAQPGKTVTTNIPAVKGLYTVQVSSWTKLADAEREARKLREAGFDTFVQKAKVGEKYYYRVRVGSFTTMTEAREALEAIEKRTGKKGWIDRMRKDM